MKRSTLTPNNDEIVPVYLFAGLRFRPDQGLFRDDQRLPLPPKETQLLQLLLSGKGNVVSQATIENTLWPRQEIRYESLARCVYSLRKLLRQSGVDCIETVPRNGYRISEPIEVQLPFRPVSARLDSVETSSTTAYSYYLAGLREASNPRPEKLELAIEFLHRAVKLDPGYSAALAAIADVTMYQCVRGYVAPDTALRRSLQACRTVMNNNTLHVPARVILAWFEGMVDQKLEEGLAMLDEALRDDPEYSAGYAHRSWFMRGMGDAKAAARDQKNGLRLNPQALLNRHGLAFTLFHSLDVDRAIALERELADTYPDDDTAHAYLAVFSAYKGRSKEALEAATRALELSSDIPAVVANIAYVEAAVGSRSRATELARFALDARPNRCPRPHIIPALCELGREDEAVELLLASKKERCPWFYGMRTDPRLAHLMLDSRLATVYD